MRINCCSLSLRQLLASVATVFVVQLASTGNGQYITDQPVVIQQAQPQTSNVSNVSSSSVQQRMREMEIRMSQLEAELAQSKAVQSHESPSAEFTSANAAAEGSAKKEEKKAEDPMAMSGKWNNGLEFETKDKNFRVHVGGRTQLDGVWLDNAPDAFAGAGGVGDEDSVNFRRARLRVDGTFYKYYEFAVEYDFANSVNDNVGLQPASDTAGNVIAVTAPTDLWWGVKEVPFVGNLRIGNMKEPIGLEHVASSRFLDFMERSYNQDAFYGPFNNGFSPGVMVFDWNECETMTWAVGAFKNTTNVFAFDTDEGGYAATGRVTWLPIYANEGEQLMHLGLGGSYRDTNDERIRLRSRASLRNGPGVLNPVLADTGTFFADSESLIAPEAAIVAGPWLFQAEYTGAWVMDAISNVPVAPPGIGAPQGSVYFQGYYVEALYFLTGEHREYETKEARFGRVKPHTNGYLIRQGNCCPPLWHTGAWQVGVRYAKLDLTDKAINGGTIQDVTIGLNWFINPNLKVQWNYVYTDRDAPGPSDGGDFHGVGMRIAHDF